MALAVATFLAIAALVGHPSPTVAQEASGGATTWSISPSGADERDTRSAMEHVVEPGETRIDHVVVDNLGDSPIVVDLYAADAKPANGEFDVGAADEAAEGVGAWLSLAEDRVEIPARSHVIVEAEIAVPDDAPPGDHSGGILASRRSVGEGEVGLETERRVGTRVHLRVVGPIDPRLVVDDLAATHEGALAPMASGEVEVSYRIRNAGNVRLSGDVEVTVSGPRGWAEKDLSAPDIEDLLPGHDVEQTATVEGVRPLGPLTVEVVVTPTASIDQPLAGTVSPGRATVTLWAVPWSAIALVVGAIAAALAVAWRRRRNRASVDTDEESAPDTPAGTEAAKAGAPTTTAAGRADEPATEEANDRAGADDQTGGPR